MYGFQPVRAKRQEAPEEVRKPPTQLLGTGAAARAAGLLRNRKAQIDAASNYRNGGMVKDYMDGGMVNGAGTGTSDSIKAMVPVGSYVMPADSTKAMGFKPRQINVSNGEMIFNPKQVQAIGMGKLDKIRDATHAPAKMKSTSSNYVDGGVVTDEERRRQAMVNQNPGASSAESSAAANALADRGPVSGLGFRSAFKAPPSALTGGMDDTTGAVKAGSPQAQDPNRGQPTPTAPTAPTALEKAIPITSPDLNGKPPGENPAGEVVSSAREIAPGVFKQGRGQYSDSAEGMGFAPGFTGRPNAQNMAAAEALARRSAARGFQPQPMPQQVEQPRLSGSGFGILDRDYQERRAAMMDAQRLRPGARGVLNSIMQQQAQRPGMELERDKMAAGERAGAADREMRQQELTARMGDAEATRALRAQEVGDNMATNAVRREAAGFEVEGARRLLSLQNEYLNARTPEAQASAANRLAALQGATSPGKAPAPPPGYRWAPDGRSMEAVPGGPADLKAGEMGAKRDRQREAAINQADRVIGMTNKAAGQVNNLSAGFIGSLTKGLPGSDARDLSSNLETVKANLGFAELQAMRDASPTGGALGAIAVQELVALQSTVASLDQAQSPAQLRANLQKIGEHYERWKSAVDQANNPDGQQASPENATPQRQAEGSSNAQASKAQTTQEQWSQLPVGALYIAPDGSIRRKK